MLYENKLFVDGVCIDHAHINAETAKTIQAVLSECSPRSTSMLAWIVSAMVCDTFDQDVGKWQSKNEKQIGLKIHFARTNDTFEQDQYHYRDLLLFGEANYVGVYTCTTFAGKKIGQTPWEVLGYHDSCWRDAVKGFFFQYEKDLNCLAWVPGGHWYMKEPITPEVSKTLKEIRNKRYAV